jgi:hypothetical protein
MNLEERAICEGTLSIDSLQRHVSFDYVEMVFKYHERFISSTSSAVCRIIPSPSFAVSPASFPSSQILSGLARPQSEITLHTVDYFSHLAIDARYFVVDGVRKFQNLSSRHQSLIVCQFVQSLQRILDISPPQQFIQIFFCIQ